MDKPDNLRDMIENVIRINNRFYKRSLEKKGSVGIASRVPRVTLALACSEGLYTLFYPSS
jgi:hypothetical protein